VRSLNPPQPVWVSLALLLLLLLLLQWAALSVIQRAHEVSGLTWSGLICPRRRRGIIPTAVSDRRRVIPAVLCIVSALEMHSHLRLSLASPPTQDPASPESAFESAWRSVGGNGHGDSVSSLASRCP